jgi:hypothetical protein
MGFPWLLKEAYLALTSAYSFSFLRKLERKSDAHVCWFTFRFVPTRIG